MLDSEFAKCGPRMVGFCVLASVAAILIGYISYQFYWNFIPYLYKEDEGYTFW